MQYGRFIRSSEVFKQLLSICLLLLIIMFVTTRMLEDSSILMGCGVASEKITQLCSAYPEHAACKDGISIGATP